MSRKPKLPKSEVALPGGHAPEELETLRRLEIGLTADGYAVARVGIALGGEAAALVYALRDEPESLRGLLKTARAFLRLSERLEADARLEVYPDELAVLERLGVAMRRVLDLTVPLPPRTVGEVLDVDLSRLRKENDDAEDEDRGDDADRGPDAGGPAVPPDVP